MNNFGLSDWWDLTRSVRLVDDVGLWKWTVPERFLDTGDKNAVLLHLKQFVHLGDNYQVGIEQLRHVVDSEASMDLFQISSECLHQIIAKWKNALESNSKKESSASKGIIKLALTLHCRVLDAQRDAETIRLLMESPFANLLENFESAIGVQQERETRVAEITKAIVQYQSALKDLETEREKCKLEGDNWRKSICQDIPSPRPRDHGVSEGSPKKRIRTGEGARATQSPRKKPRRNDAHAPTSSTPVIEEGELVRPLHDEPSIPGLSL